MDPATSPEAVARALNPGDQSGLPFIQQPQTQGRWFPGVGGMLGAGYHHLLDAIQHPIHAAQGALATHGLGTQDLHSVAQPLQDYMRAQMQQQKFDDLPQQ